MAQIPPPVHGAALRNKSLLDSKLLNAEFNIIPLPLKFIDDMKEMGKVTPSKLLMMIRYAFRMIYILLFRKVDLAYFTMSPSGGAFYRDVLFITILKMFRKKRLLHFRVKGFKQTVSGKIGRFLVKFTLSNSNIVCLSKHHIHDLDGLITKEPFIVPNGIRIEKEFLYLADNYNHVNSAVPKLLFLSNLSVRKGVPELISSLKILHEKGYKFQVSLVGDEWDMTFKDVQQAIDAASLHERIKIEGPKYGREKFEFIASADIFVFPTYFELFPGVLLEAMQFGKSIVSTFEGSIPEIIDQGKTGLLVTPKDTEALAEALAYMIDNPEERVYMAKKAKEKFFQEYTLEAFEKRMHVVLEEVIQ